MTAQSEQVLNDEAERAEADMERRDAVAARVDAELPAIMEEAVRSLSVAPRDQLALLIPDADVLKAAFSLATNLAKAGCVPSTMRGKPADIFAVIMHGAAVGFPPMQAIQQISIINGKTSIYGDGGRALLVAHPELELIEDVQEHVIEAMPKEERYGECTIKRAGRKAVTCRFTYAMATRAHLIGKTGPWTEYESRMYKWKAFWWAARDTFPDVLQGLYAYEEAIDIPPRVLNPEPDRGEPVSPAPEAQSVPQDAQPAQPEPSEPHNTNDKGEELALSGQLSQIADRWSEACAAHPYHSLDDAKAAQDGLILFLKAKLQADLPDGVLSVTRKEASYIIGECKIQHHKGKYLAMQKRIDMYPVLRDAQYMAINKTPEHEKTLGKRWPATIEELVLPDWLGINTAPIELTKLRLKDWHKVRDEVGRLKYALDKLAVQAEAQPAPQDAQPAPDEEVNI